MVRSPGVMSGDGRSPGYEWVGSLAEVDLATLYERCAELRLSGRLFLHREAEGSGSGTVVEFLGGDPADPIDDVSPRWRAGRFRLVQALPDLSGALTEGLELRGTLIAASPRALIRHCQTLRLSVDLFLQRRRGERALVRFAHGRVDTAAVDGVPELGALARVERWTDGEFRLILRPLFTEDAPAPPPPVPPVKEVGGQDFDLSTRTQMPPLRPQDRKAAEEDGGGRGSFMSAGLTQAAGGEVSVGAAPANRPAMRYSWIWMMAAMAVLGLGALTWILTRHS